MRLNLTTLGYIQRAMPEAESNAGPLPIFTGIPLRSDNSLATGIVEVDWSDERVETIDLLVRSV